VPLLDRLGVRATVFACTDYADDGRPLDIPELRVEAETHPGELATMGWDELREIGERKLEVGSHTRTHAHLTELSESELREEVRGSRERLEDELGIRCRFLAYPYGEHDPRVRAAARAAGYAAAFALPGPEGPIDFYQVPRIGIWRRDGIVRGTLKTTAPGRRVARRVQVLPRRTQRHPPGVRASS
jgi:peptidoglycan/xylan/chitin deacetylase (PgdA/CDA1 family)